MSNKRRIRSPRVVPVIENHRYTLAVGKDMQFFEQNPTLRSYTRPATKDEQRAYSLPPGTRCAVVRVDRETHVRMFRVSTPTSEGLN